MPLSPLGDHAPRWSTARLAAQSLVLALVVGGTTTFSSLTKTVELEVDGQTTTVTAFGRTVDDVLAAHGLELGPNDLVAPSSQEVVADGSEIVVRRAREVTVEVDGDVQDVWTTARTVGEVVAELGVRGEARTSASRSAALGRGVLRVSTPKTVQVVVDGATHEASTAAMTVREVLQESGVVLGPYDQVSAPLDADTTDGLVVTVTRVTTVTGSETVTQPFETVREDDPTLLKGREVVAVAGVEGVRVTTYQAQVAGDAEIARTVLGEVTLQEPVDEVVRVGTKEPPPPPPPAPARAASSAPAQVASVAPGTSRAIAQDMVLARGWSQDQFSCLDSLWQKESGWRVNAANPSSGAYGIPQSLPGSKMASAGADWRSNPATQISWGLGYIAARYGTPCAAWQHSQARNWY